MLNIKPKALNVKFVYVTQEMYTQLPRITQGDIQDIIESYGGYLKNKKHKIKMKGNVKNHSEFFKMVLIKGYFNIFRIQLILLLSS